jgi:hypothetical protein
MTIKDLPMRNVITTLERMVVLSRQDAHNTQQVIPFELILGEVS